MNRAERRKQAQLERKRQELWTFGEARRVTPEKCFIDTHLIRREMFAQGVLHGHPNAMQLVIPIADFLTKSAASIRGQGPLCLSCETEFTASELPIDFIVSGLHTGPQILMTGICIRCSEQSNDELMEKGMQQMKKIWTDAVELPDGGGMH